jgi:hypothetical protein
MTELSYIDGLLALAGVVVGFALSSASGIIKDAKRKNTIKKALCNELTNILDILQKAEKSLDSILISNDKFPFIVETYESVKLELASFLKPSDLWIVQRAYAQVSKLNREKTHENPEGFVHPNKFWYDAKSISLTIDLVTRALRTVC